jgi:hypothetical protein
VFDRYNITAEDDLRAAMRGLGQYLERQPNRPKVTPIATADGSILGSSSQSGTRRSRTS